MPLIPPTHDALPYIDLEPTTSQRTAAESLIQAEVALPTSTPLTHPLLPPPPPENYTPLMLSEFIRLSTSTPLTGIDSSRYESLSPPSPSSSPSSSEKAISAWRAALTQAHTSHTYLTNRRANLEALEKDGKGKEAWLAGNEELVAELRALETELAGVKEGIDFTVVERRNRQEGVRGEMEALEKAWKGGVGRVLETEVAAEAVRMKVLEARRGGA